MVVILKTIGQKIKIWTESFSRGENLLMIFEWVTYYIYFFVCLILKIKWLMFYIFR